MQDQICGTQKNQGNTGKPLFRLAIILGSISLCVLFQRFYLVGELLVFVACAALLAFFVANLVILGILLQAAGRSIWRSVRKTRPGIPSREQVPVESTGLVHRVAIRGPFAK